VAGSPALLDEEPKLLQEAESLLAQVLAARPDNFAAEDLLLQVRLAKDAERYRRLYGYREGFCPESSAIGAPLPEAVSGALFGRTDQAGQMGGMSAFHCALLKNCDISSLTEAERVDKYGDAHQFVVLGG